MEYLTLEECKQQLIIDSSFNEDDSYIISLATVAEELVNEHVDGQLATIVAEHEGVLPAPLHHAMLMVVDYLYDYRGSGEQRDVPEAFFVLCKTYINYNIG